MYIWPITKKADQFPNLKYINPVVNADMNASLMAPCSLLLLTRALLLCYIQGLGCCLGGNNGCYLLQYRQHYILWQSPLVFQLFKLVLFPIGENLPYKNDSLPHVFFFSNELFQCLLTVCSLKSPIYTCRLHAFFVLIFSSLASLHLQDLIKISKQRVF